MRTPDLRVYGILDPDHCRGRDPIEALGHAIDGGVTLVQLRCKTLTTRQIQVLGRQAREVCTSKGVPLLVNDRVDIAMAIGADGVHLGQTDLEPGDARRLMGEAAMIGVTVHHAEEATTFDRRDIDYAGVGPVFETSSKVQKDEPIGVAGLRNLRELLRGLPVCGISGIRFENAAKVIEADADGVAVISEIFAADDVQAAASRLRRIVDEALSSDRLEA